ncbi:hypothetical protein [Legionella parisiensis]|uniref:Uncharacterized protein n=1 Tax=Legionella parisiensis TaxID=45071 RepID=A0A1E5JW13_9GAMM|nr:hypothetical protein [Legionella parisiensis]KTD40583.1 RNA binding protein (contains ribosomal protein S1 domain) [Legionella parisiensis]OEH48722.1 hypothetical protein lpari_00252 [Legionella parisiensis]STX77024.1 RNA binding protein (contains ribosomal protein S1 domain) [Legionella parisiensis]
MIILYIPFHEENDLIAHALHWKETLNDENIVIVQHGKPINYKLMEHDYLTIYVLAHGVDNLLEYFQLASTCSSTNQPTYLGIDKIAERFNCDFVYVHHKISNIKLYFCNNKGNQKTLAEKFNSNLVLFDAFIDYYAGTLFSPSTDKKKYSYCHGKWYSSSNVRRTLHKNRDWQDPNDQISIKQLSMLNFLENAKQNRIDLMVNKQKKARQKLMMQRRNERQKADSEMTQTTESNKLSSC